MAFHHKGENEGNKIQNDQKSGSQGKPQKTDEKPLATGFTFSGNMRAANSEWKTGIGIGENTRALPGLICAEHLELRNSLP